ncbi:MAG: DUF6577 family protein [Bacilli bacterium]
MKAIKKDITNLKKKIITKETLKIIIRKNKPLYKDTSIRWTIYKLVSEGVISKVDNNLYYLGKLKKYTPKNFSALRNKIKNKLEASLKDIRFIIYESTNLNEWVNHQISKNVIFVEVEKYFMMDVFRLIQEFHNNVLFSPSVDEFYLYQGDLVVVNQLITQAPINNQTREMKLEKLIVDFYTKDLINEFINDSEKENIIYSILSTYQINRKTILAYAKRRNNYAKIKDVLEQIEGRRS